MCRQVDTEKVENKTGRRPAKLVRQCSNRNEKCLGHQRPGPEDDRMELVMMMATTDDDDNDDDDDDDGGGGGGAKSKK